MGPIGWLLQWPVRALVLLLVAAMPLGVEFSGFSTALGSAALIDGFRLRNGLSSAVLGAVAYSVLSTVFIRLLGLGDVELIRAALA
jgi:putative membrane protein